jgi:hypothetical protein
MRLELRFPRSLAEDQVLAVVVCVTRSSYCCPDIWQLHGLADFEKPEFLERARFKVLKVQH